MPSEGQLADPVLQLWREYTAQAGVPWTAEVAAMAADLGAQMRV